MSRTQVRGSTSTLLFIQHRLGLTLRSPPATHFFAGKNSGVIETANTSQPLAQLSCFRGGFKACHKTSCIVNSAASMADWWAICLVDCLAPGPWSYVYVWALLFHMYRPPDHFLLPHPPPPTTLALSLAELMVYAHKYAWRHIKGHTGHCTGTHAWPCMHAYGPTHNRNIKSDDLHKGWLCPSRLHYCQYK